jgi:hypothetical protein
MDTRTHELVLSGTNLSGVVMKTAGAPSYVVGEEGQNILAVSAPSRVLVPLFLPVVSEAEYLDACMDCFREAQGREPNEVHVFKADKDGHTFLGMCVL